MRMVLVFLESKAEEQHLQQQSHMASNSMETSSQRQVVHGPQSPLSGPQNSRTHARHAQTAVVHP